MPLLGDAALTGGWLEFCDLIVSDLELAGSQSQSTVCHAWTGVDEATLGSCCTCVIS